MKVRRLQYRGAQPVMYGRLPDKVLRLDNVLDPRSSKEICTQNCRPQIHSPVFDLIRALQRRSKDTLPVPQRVFANTLSGCLGLGTFDLRSSK
ncbi:hypothetical protein TNIN_369861 [Trichonephila inaurata madagascariensis]|uniref:Uncharacterized protein n=1 Tax=Trichonephila inaurata madagascariensis TaxID=2747483 RepID=A0A8X6IXK1_9ARAC|nr:hypothetical protein TNIN_369861 [Trichonephila inaurata madagascariensis]